MRGKPFVVGNKLGTGRPLDSRNKKSIFQEALESHGIEIIDTAKLQALKKDPTALRLCVERLVPICKPPNSSFRMPRLRTSTDLPKAISALAREVAAGRLSAQEGESVSRIIESFGNALQVDDFATRLETIEQENSEMEK
jgi:hypothetical protein